MRYRKVGRWGLEVSEIGLGSWLTYGGSVDEDAAIACILRAFELGVNLFDTANVYAHGRAERVVGRALRALPREDVVVATKVFFPMGDGPNDGGLSRKHVTEQCHASLRRLEMDYVDIYQCHRFDQSTPLDETCRAMDDLVRRGSILYWGVSEWMPDQMHDAVSLCGREGLHPPISDQPRYSLLERGIEAEVLAACAELGLGVLAFSALAQGVLTGKYAGIDDPPEDSRAADPAAGAFLMRLLTQDNLGVVQRLRPIAADLGCSLAQLAIAWALRRREVSSVLVGASKRSQVDDNVAASGIALDATALERIERVLSER
jgi:aryl-alcohol dehydrogenase-like predicted oxidoreductase